ncbi:MAG: hypothetical protein KAH99_07075, partial [Verrucomicrobia bacterium]|nr:hypothetical protein [Verrucomicrobiota bacterium]
LVLVLLLIVFEVLVIFGVFELKAQTVAKHAPWAYESFLKLVGEHPGSAPRWASVEEPEEKEAVKATMAGVTGLEPSAIPVLVETNEAVLSTNLILEATVPLETDPEPIPIVAPTEVPADELEESVPVG